MNVVLDAILKAIENRESKGRDDIVQAQRKTVMYEQVEVILIQFSTARKVWIGLRGFKQLKGEDLLRVEVKPGLQGGSGDQVEWPMADFEPANLSALFERLGVKVDFT